MMSPQGGVSIFQTRSLIAKTSSYEQHVPLNFISDKVNLMPDFAASALETGKATAKAQQIPAG
jgi:hypothetical protein